MLIDAFKAEAYRLCQNWLQVVVAVLIVPVIVIVGGAAILHQAAAKGGAAAAAVGMDPAAPSSPLNMMEAFSFAAAHSANGVTLIMMLIAAATLYAGDYRWETWRLISARNDRTSLLLGKVAVMKLLALTGMATFLFSSIVYSLIKAGVFERSLSFSADRGELIAFGLVWILSWVRILQFTMFALLAGVLSRSLLFALIAPWALGFGQQLLGAGLQLIEWPAQSWQAQLLLPGLAYDSLKAAAQGAEMQEIWRSLTSLFVWTLAPLIGALFVFSRQDLSKE